MYKFNYNFEKNICDWLGNVTGLTVVAEENKYKNPETLTDFVSYSVDAPIRVGVDDVVYKESDTYTIKALRMLPVDVRIYASNCLEIAENLRMGLYSGDILETYFTNCSVINNDSITDISEALSTGYDRRALLTFSAVATITLDVDLGYINEVELTGTIDTLLEDIIIEKQIGG